MSKQDVQPHAPSIYEINARTELTLTQRQKIVRRLLPTVLAGGMVLGVGVDEGAHYLHDSQEVGTTVVTVDDHKTAINTVDAGVKEIERQHRIDPTSIPQDEIVYAGQEVGGDIQRQTHRDALQPGDAIKVTVSQNGLGRLLHRYRVSADPAPESDR